MVTTINPEYYIDTSLESIASDEIMKFENSVLEQKYPDFRYLMNEFHDGILLFDISSKKIWNRVQEDSAGLQKYYESHKKEYLSKKSIEAKIYTLKKPEGAKRLMAAYRKYSRKSGTDARLLAKFNMEGDTLLSIAEAIWTTGDDADLDKIDWTPGLHSLTKNGYPTLINILKVNEPAPLPLNDVQADMISGYQDWLTEEWIKQLKKKYTVKIDSQVFDEVKKRLGNE
jgi:peptidyl-prolyl cis-trans isomerase SurA